MPTNKAGQLSPGTSLGAAANMATVTIIFTSSQPINPVRAAPAEFRLRTMPRANSAAGTTTDKAPYPTDQAICALFVSNHANSANRKPASACMTTTRHTDRCG